MICQILYEPFSLLLDLFLESRETLRLSPSDLAAIFVQQPNFF